MRGESSNRGCNQSAAASVQRVVVGAVGPPALRSGRAPNSKTEPLRSTIPSNTPSLPENRAPLAGLRGVLLFHANLLYSSIDAHQRAQVLDRCYRPLLGLLDERPWLDLAFEATGHTLELAAELDPEWMQRLRTRIEQGRVEFIGSGDTQLIGPLVPERVHRANQELGQQRYRELLGRSPTTALVNEAAWSQGLVDGYLDAGYELLISEWNNPRRHHPEWEDDERWRLARTRSPRGSEIDLAWIDTTTFQKLQRMVHGELESQALMDWLGSQSTGEERLMFVYASDAEVFDFRPGRYRTEAPPNRDSEWRRLGRALDSMHEDGLRFELPRRAQRRPALASRAVRQLSSLADPIPVKKQPKYNITRWALSGRDDLGANACCFARYAELCKPGRSDDREAWRELCRAWASDLRTHLTEARWSEVQVSPASAPSRSYRGERRLRGARIEPRGRRLLVRTGGVEVVLDPRRGLAIDSLCFPAFGEKALLGTLPHGTFDAIEYTADFYSGHTVLEVPGHRRVTDLEPCSPQLKLEEDALVLQAEVSTSLGKLNKRVMVFEDSLELQFELSNLGTRPPGSLRTGILTWIPEALGEGPWIECSQGGAPERFRVTEDANHGAGVSPFVSASAAFGTSDGHLSVTADDWALDLDWDATHCPALPLLTSVRIGQARMLRLAFSVSELDETHRPGAPLRDFHLSIRPRKGRP